MWQAQWCTIYEHKLYVHHIQTALIYLLTPHPSLPLQPRSVAPGSQQRSRELLNTQNPLDILHRPLALLHIHDILAARGEWYA